MSDAASPTKAYWSLAGLREGALAVAALVPGQMSFGMAFGILAAETKFSLTETVVMTGTVYAGLAQVAALQAWPQALTWASLGAIALVTATINARFFLMSFTFRPWFGTLPAWQVYPMLAITTDIGWLKAMRYHAEGGADASYFLGGCLVMYVCWVTAAVPGYLLATSIADPKVFGLDLVVLSFFSATLIPSWRGLSKAVPWVVSAIVAVSVARFVAGYWFIMAGALAGALAAALMHDGEIDNV